VCRPTVSTSPPRPPAARRARRVRGPDHAPRRVSAATVPARDHPAAVDDDDVVDQVLHLGEQVARHQHGVASGGTGAQQVAQVTDALRVEAIGGLVEHEHGRVGRAALRPARAAASSPTSRCRRGVGPPRVERPTTASVSSTRSCPIGLLRWRDAQVVAARTAGVEGVGFEHDPDGAGGIGELA
jgi:hypothetical protein